MSPLINLERFETVPGEHRPRPIRSGLLFLALLALGLYCGFTRSIPFTGEDGVLVKAQFDRATNVITGNLVRVNGVDVGKVTAVERDPSGRGALVSMRVEEDGFALHADARASIYWRTLLGRNMYIELQPGSPSAPPLAGATIGMDRTQSQVEFDELLDSYDEDGRAGVRSFLREGDEALRGAEAGRAIERIAPGLKPAAPALTALRGTARGTDLPGLAATGAEVLEAVSRSEAALGGLVDHADTVLGVTAARRADLAATLQRTPASLAETRATLARLRTTLDVLDPVAAALRPGLRATPSAVRRTTTALSALRAATPATLSALRDLRPALVSLRAASREGAPLARDLGPTLTRLDREVLPFLEEVSPTTELKNYQAIGPFFSALASSSSQFDANGHMQRFMPGQGLDSVGPLPCSLSIFDPASGGQLAKCREALSLLPQIVAGAPRKGGGRQALTARRTGR